MTVLSNLNVLVIDDIETVRNVLVKHLKQLGINKVKTTDCIYQGWNIMEDGIESNDEVDIVFSDWNMPNGDGIYLLEKIRKSDNERLRLIKFVMVTGAHNKVLEAMDKGAHNIIHKPFDSKIIKEKFELIFGNLETAVS
jgi:two-component system chemotaxis response regulator CheY